MKVRRAHSNVGFTAIEIMVVAVVLTALLALAIPLYESSRRNSRLSACRANITSIYQAEEAYRTRRRTYTTTLSDLSLGTDLTCPADGSHYQLSPGSTGIADSIIISCPGAGAHTTNPIYTNGVFTTQGTP